MTTNDSAPQPTDAQKRWEQLGYGMFLHFGPNTYAGDAWGDGTFPAEKMDLTTLDVDQWARVAAEAGMKYAVLTTKHHDGFCLWPSKHTEYSVKNSPGGKDVVALFADAFSRAGLKVGLYYSIWDRNCPVYADDDAYARFMRDQLTELLTGYGEIVQVWTDGAWDKDHPTKEWPFDPAWLDDPDSGYTPGTRYEWEAFYDHCHALQPDVLVMNNSSSDRPGQPRYFPIDCRTHEHFDFISRGAHCRTMTETAYTDHKGRRVYLPLEFEATITPSWFWIEGQEFLHPTVATLCGWHRRARELNANLLLNVGPDNRGRLPDYHIPFLRAAAKELFG